MSTGRAFTISVRRDGLRRAEEALGEPVTAEELEEHARAPRPQTRAECIDGPRPCPWVGCAHHAYLDVDPASGTIKLNHPGRDVADLERSCVLDLADEGVQTLELVGEVLNLTRERVRQIEVRAALRLRSAWLDRKLEQP